MNQNPILRGVGATPTPAAPGEVKQAEGSGGVAFRALLDQLQEKARRLKRDGEAVSQPAELTGAVDRARASIDDALSLGDRLLEAYRASRQVADAAGAGELDGRRDS